MHISIKHDVVCTLLSVVVHFAVFQTDFDFLSYREDFTNAAVFSELRARIPQVSYALLFTSLILTATGC